MWVSPVSFDRVRVREPFSPHWLAQQENVILCGPVGVGKTFLAHRTHQIVMEGPSLRGRQRPELAQGQAGEPAFGRFTGIVRAPKKDLLRPR